MLSYIDYKSCIACILGVKPDNLSGKRKYNDIVESLPSVKLEGHKKNILKVDFDYNKYKINKIVLDLDSKKEGSYNIVYRGKAQDDKGRPIYLAVRINKQLEGQDEAAGYKEALDDVMKQTELLCMFFASDYKNKEFSLPFPMTYFVRRIHNTKNTIMAMKWLDMSLEEYILHHIDEHDDECFLEIILQLLYCLRKLEKSILFVHCDLHLGNIMLQKRPKVEQTSYEYDGVNLSLSSEFRVFFIDFGNSIIDKKKTRTRGQGMLDIANIFSYMMSYFIDYSRACTIVPFYYLFSEISKVIYADALLYDPPYNTPIQDWHWVQNFYMTVPDTTKVNGTSADKALRMLLKNVSRYHDIRQTIKCNSCKKNIDAILDLSSQTPDHQKNIYTESSLKKMIRELQPEMQRQAEKLLSRFIRCSHNNGKLYWKMYGHRSCSKKIDDTAHKYHILCCIPKSYTISNKYIDIINSLLMKIQSDLFNLREEAIDIFYDCMKDFLIYGKLVNIIPDQKCKMFLNTIHELKKIENPGNLLNDIIKNLESIEHIFSVALVDPRDLLVIRNIDLPEYIN